MRTSVVIEWLSILRNEYGRWRHIETLFMRGVHLGAIDWAPDVAFVHRADVAFGRLCVMCL